MDLETLQQLIVSLGLGMLLGFQRERTESSLGGIRVLIVLGDMTAAVVLGGAMAVLLQLKRPLHGFAQAVGENDMRAIIQFVLITMIILPVLPDEAYGPYDVLNPYKIWLMVVLIVGIGLCGYIAYKLFGGRAGTILGGVIGGLVSSTATTVSYAKRAGDGNGGLASLGVLVVMIASCVSFVRVLVVIVIVARGAFPALAPPLAAMLGACTLISVSLYLQSRNKRAEMPEQKNPTELKAALVFGALYALVLLGAAYAREHFGSRGLYTVAAISGLTDMSAITLSTAQMAARGAVEEGTAWRAILIASMTNFVFKFGIVAALASREMTLRVGIAFAAALAAAGLILALWPG